MEKEVNNEGVIMGREIWRGANPPTGFEFLGNLDGKEYYVGGNVGAVPKIPFTNQQILGFLLKAKRAGFTEL